MNGKSPRAIAQALNREKVTGPRGAAWGQITINGNAERGTGILNNELYIGRLVWNRLRYVKVPQTGKRVSRPNPTEKLVSFPAVTSPGPATLLGILPTGDGGMLSFGVAGLADRSADGGQTWASLSLGAQSNLTCGRVMKSGAILIGGEDGSLYLSTDHGRNFHALAQSEPMAIFDLAQAPDGDILVAGSGGVLTLPGAALK